MSERERKVQAMKQLLINAREATLNADEEAAYILNNGGDVELPKYEPGQYARVVLGDGSWALGERNDANTGWLIPGDNGLFHDDEVKAVDPVLVITSRTALDHCVSLAKQVGGILDHSHAGLLAGEALEDIYREGGLIL